MNDFTNILKLFDSIKENPNKSVRIYTNRTEGVMCTENAKLGIEHAIFAEFVGDERRFYHVYDSQNQTTSEHKVTVMMKKNKELAYVCCTSEETQAGYVCCKPKHRDDDTEWEHNDVKDHIFFGIITTKGFVVVLAISSNNHKTMLWEFLREEERPNIKDVFLTLTQANSISTPEVVYGQEE